MLAQRQRTEENTSSKSVIDTVSAIFQTPEGGKRRESRRAQNCTVEKMGRKSDQGSVKRGQPYLHNSPSDHSSLRAPLRRVLVNIKTTCWFVALKVP